MIATLARPDAGGLSDRIADDLRDSILSGRLAAGAPLRQDHLAAAYGASHIPVREALRRLEADGLVTRYPRRGAFVAALSAGDAREVTEMRVALECLAARHAVPAATEADLKAAEAEIAAADRSPDIADWAEANWRFHRSLYAPAGRPRLLSSIEGLWRHADRYLRVIWHQFDYQGRSQDEHRALVDAYRAGDADLAARLVAAHVEDAGNTLLGLLADRLT